MSDEHKDSDSWAPNSVVFGHGGHTTIPYAVVYFEIEPHEVKVMLEDGGPELARIGPDGWSAGAKTLYAEGSATGDDGMYTILSILGMLTRAIAERQPNPTHASVQEVLIREVEASTPPLPTSPPA